MKKSVNTALRCISWLVFFPLFICFVQLFQPVYESRACMICVPYPETTLADRLLENEEIILARELANSPYLFAPIEIIRGEATTGPIKIFCDSSTRRKLKLIADSSVVLARKSKDAEWHLVTFADRQLQTFIRSLIENGRDWTSAIGAQRRVDYFAQHLTSEHPLIQKQAYLEVGRAPYDRIKSLAMDIPREQIYEFLGNIQYIEWRSLYILFLGQSSHPEDHAFIRQRVESSLHLSMTTNLAAWLTAFIETNPDRGVTEIEKWYLSNPGRPRDVMEEVVTSLSVLGSQTGPTNLSLFLLRQKIVYSYGTLLQNYPEMAGRVAKDLAMWRVRAHIDRLAEIQKSNSLAEPSEHYLLDYYLSMAGSYPRR